MKVFLLHPDRDFEAAPPPPFNEAALTQDLELNTLFNAMAQNDEYLFDTVRQIFFSSLDAPEGIRYRQAILSDCLKNPAVVREIYSIPMEALERKHKRWMGIFSRYPSGILSDAVQMLELFVELLKKLRHIADEHASKFESEGLGRFFRMIQQELNEQYFATVEKHIKTLKFQHGVLVSAELGNGNEGTHYVLRQANYDDRNWFKRLFTKRSPTYSFTLDSRDEAGARALGDLRNRGINLVANAAAQSADHIDGFLNTLRLELAFYLGCLNLAEGLAHLGEPIVFPEPLSAAARNRSFTGLYDVCLALVTQKKVVGNDLQSDGKNLTIITGANQGGKSTFLRSIGLAQLMLQCGMFVPAEAFQANVCTRLFTHYKREEDSTMTSGKFDEELVRASEIVDHVTPNSIVLFNESFAATNEREGSEIAKQIVQALLEAHVEIFYVTHLYEFAYGFHDRGLDNAMFLRADRQADGHRTYKLLEGAPLKTSFGMDAYHKIFGE